MIGKAGLRGMGLSGKFGYFCSVRILLAHQINRVSGLSSRYKAEVLMLGEIRICYVCMFFYKKQKKRKSAFNRKHSVSHQNPFKVGVDYSNTGSTINSFVCCNGRLGPGPRR